MANSHSVTLYVNIVGAVCALGIGSYFVRSMFEDGSTPRCSSTYPPAQQVVFEGEAGRPFTPVELQARAGASERGMLENAKVVHVEGAPARSVLEVHVGGSADQAGIRSGWPVSGLRSASAACLAYSVWLPDGFDYGNLGLLPGLYAGRKLEPDEAPVDGAGFATRVRWHSQGAGDVLVQAPGSPDGQGFGFAGNGVSLPSGRWIRVEHEVVLNAPGQSDGQLRVWLDGKLVAEAGGIPFRADPTITLAGVTGDIGYGGHRPGAGGALRISPFDVSWR